MYLYNFLIYFKVNLILNSRCFCFIKVDIFKPPIEGQVAED